MDRLTLLRINDTFTSKKSDTWKTNFPGIVIPSLSCGSDGPYLFGWMRGKLLIAAYY